jgi:hypothetical protein
MMAGCMEDLIQNLESSQGTGQLTSMTTVQLQSLELLSTTFSSMGGHPKLNITGKKSFC